MDIREFLRIIRTRWLSVVLMLAVGLGGALTSLGLATTEYTASTSLYIAVQSSTGSATELGQGSNAAQLKTKTYPDVVSSAVVLQPVVDRLHLRETTTELAQRVRASTGQNSVLLRISAVDRRPEVAAEIANAVGESFRTVVTGSLEKPLDGGDSLVRVETIQPAVVPTAPSAPKTSVTIALGAFAGLLAGVALALFRNAVDTRIRGKRDVETATTAAFLGEIAYDSNAELSPLIMQHDPRNPRAESFRALRTSLMFVDLDGTHSSFVITSAMPSEGKTTSAANLAIALAENGARVALIDADLRRSRLAAVMGLDRSVGLADVLIGRAEVDDVAQPWGRGGLTVIPAGQVPPNPSEMLGSEAMRTLIQQLEDEYDYVLFDAPPLLPVTDASVLSRLTSGAVVIGAAGRTRRPQLERALEQLDGIGARVLGVVLTMVQRSSSSSYSYDEEYGYGYGEDQAGRRPSKRTKREGKMAARAEKLGMRPQTIVERASAPKSEGRRRATE